MNQPIGNASLPPVSEPTDVPVAQPTPIPPPNAIPASLSISGGATDTLPRPRAAAVDEDGNIYIFTEVDSKIKKFDPSGAEVTSWDVRMLDGQPSERGLRAPGARRENCYFLKPLPLNWSPTVLMAKRKSALTYATAFHRAEWRYPMTAICG